ncbi:MAG: hypothetical protein MUC42_05795, partial [Bryobacter sp.]|nr:hypothetical protein [Bryobacter sp.]
LRRRLSLRLYRAPYEEQMKPWEKTLHHSGLLGYLVKDVIGAHQEESFGIRQNHTMGLQEWGELIARHFVAAEYEIFVPQRGWGETLVRRAVSTPNPEQTLWRTAKLLGGTLAAFCRKEGAPPEANFDLAARFEELLRCPDCGGSLRRNTTDTLHCTECPYSANEGGVFNLLATADKKELYPGDRPDILDFSQPSHADHLGEGWHEVEGVYGNRYRWIGPRAIARLKNVRGGPQRLRLRGFAPEPEMRGGKPVHLQIFANGQPAGVWDIDRPGLFVVEHNLPDRPDYEIEICATPVWQAPPDPRQLTLNLSMIRLVPPE